MTDIVYLLQACDEIDGCYTLQIYEKEETAEKVAALANQWHEDKPDYDPINDDESIEKIIEWEKHNPHPIKSESGYDWDEYVVTPKEIIKG